MSFYNVREWCERGKCRRFGVRQGWLRVENRREMYANSVELGRIDKTSRYKMYKMYKIMYKIKARKILKWATGYL